KRPSLPPVRSRGRKRKKRRLRGPALRKANNLCEKEPAIAGSFFCPGPSPGPVPAAETDRPRGVEGQCTGRKEGRRNGFCREYPWFDQPFFCCGHWDVFLEFAPEPAEQQDGGGKRKQKRDGAPAAPAQHLPDRTAGGEDPAGEFYGDYWTGGWPE